MGLATKPCLTPMTLWTEAHQAPLSMGFSRQEILNDFQMPVHKEQTLELKVSRDHLLLLLEK